MTSLIRVQRCWDLLIIPFMPYWSPITPLSLQNFRALTDFYRCRCIFSSYGIYMYIWDDHCAQIKGKLFHRVRDGRGWIINWQAYIGITPHGALTIHVYLILMLFPRIYKSASSMRMLIIECTILESPSANHSSETSILPLQVCHPGTRRRLALPLFLNKVLIPTPRFFCSLWYMMSLHLQSRRSS